VSTYEYFQRAFRRGGFKLIGQPGEMILGEDGNCAVFWVDARAGRIASAQYRCTTCATLLALCEHLAELMMGMELTKAYEYDADRLLALHTDVPKSHGDRAKLAMEAFRSAVQKAIQGETV
jgi:NifU-like protein involved in Fe-S cluster formation